MGRTYTSQELERYYAGKQFEFGWASLCRMILPDGLEGLTVLDIGCRRGKGVFKLSDRVGAKGRAIGVDWCRPYIEEAQQKVERAWRETGLPESNMTFAVGYPEDLAAAGVEDGSVDVIYINSVLNLAYNPAACLAECSRVLRPGGLLVLEAVTADGPRDEDIVRQAREIGNTVQSAPERGELLRWLEAAGLFLVSSFEEHVVFVDTGYKTGYKADSVESDEEIHFCAEVIHGRKPQV